jgi:hypothetical protein
MCFILGIPNVGGRNFCIDFEGLPIFLQVPYLLGTFYKAIRERFRMQQKALLQSI